LSLEDLCKFGKLQKHNTSSQEISGLFGVAKRCLKDAKQDSISFELRYISAYQAALAAGEALLYCFGYSAPKTNYHYMVWEGLRQILDRSFKNTLILFNDARSKRGDAFYDHADVTSETEYKELCKESAKFVEYVKNRIKKEFRDLAKGL
jgi:uncharacterized protein (UPF0332 family)